MQTASCYDARVTGTTWQSSWTSRYELHFSSPTLLPHLFMSDVLHRLHGLGGGGSPLPVSWLLHYISVLELLVVSSLAFCLKSCFSVGFQMAGPTLHPHRCQTYFHSLFFPLFKMFKAHSVSFTASFDCLNSLNAYGKQEVLQRQQMPEAMEISVSPSFLMAPLPEVTVIFIFPEGFH